MQPYTLCLLEQAHDHAVARVAPSPELASRARLAGPFVVRLDMERDSFPSTFPPCGFGRLSMVEGEPDTLERLEPANVDMDLFDDLRAALLP